MGAELTAKFERDYATKFEQATADMRRRGDEFYHAEGELCDQIEALQAVLAQNETYLKEEFGKAFEQRAGQFNVNYERLESELKQYGKIIKEAGEEARAELQQKDLIIAKLKGQVQLLNAPKKFRGGSADDITANKVLEFFLGRGVQVEAEDWSRKYHQLTVKLFPKGAKLADLQLLADDLQIDLGLYSKPTIKVDRSCFAIICETDAKAPAKIELPADNLNRLEKDFDKANHIRLVGPTGSGKSTFLDNLIWLGRYSWPSAQMELLDPKAPFTVWQGGIVPDFKNLECVNAIANISERLQTRFAEANKIADEFGNESAEFNRYIDGLAPYLFVLDEAQYLYRIAKAEDAKSSPKGKQANLVRDSLLDCLGVGRALEVKGYFITQSAKCSKLGMNDDDFDNATSIFLGSAISNALDSELKGEFSEAKLLKTRAEYHHRKQLGQQYLALISYSESDTLYLIQCPQPGFYHSRVLQAQTEISPGEATREKLGKAQAGQGEQLGKGEGKEGKKSPATLTVPLSDSLLPPSEGMSAACTGCGEFSTHTKDDKPNTLGKVKFHCKNDACKKKSFSAKPIVQSR